MAHFAQLNSDNIVLQVVVINNNELLDENGQENEFRGVQFCQSLFGENTIWRQTSYSGKFRKKFAGIGDKYDEQSNSFISQKPFASWLFNETTFQWEAPTPYPNDGKFYQWDEESISWKEFV